MTPAHFAYLAAFLKDRSGLSIGEEKRYLAEARLATVARRFGLASIAELVTQLPKSDRFELQRAVVEAMTTNETFFFRDREPFAAFA